MVAYGRGPRRYSRRAEAQRRQIAEWARTKVPCDYCGLKALDVTEAIFDSSAGEEGLLRETEVRAVAIESLWVFIDRCPWQAATLNVCRRA